MSGLPVRVIGIDPGSRFLGWGVIEHANGRSQHVASGTLEALGGELAPRLLSLANQLDALLLLHRPVVAAVERVFHAKNSHSALVLAHARGVALVGVARYNIPVFEFTACQIKLAVTGHGQAEKTQVQTMVQLLLNMSRAPAAPEVTPARRRARATAKLDTTDALAAALCYVGMHGTAFGRRAAAGAAGVGL